MSPSFDSVADFRNHLIYVRSLRNQRGRRIYTYDKLAETFGVNKYYLCKIVNRDDYQPLPYILEKLGIQRYEEMPVCKVHGVVHCYDCQTQDVKPKRNGRPKRKPASKVVSVGKCTPEEEDAIMGMTPNERREALLKGKRP